MCGVQRMKSEVEGDSDDEGEVLTVDLHDSFKACDFTPRSWGGDRLKVKD